MRALKGGRSIAHCRIEPLGGLEYLPTPPWATRALIKFVIGRRGLRQLCAWEPACGEGHMAAVLEEVFGRVIATDVFPYGFGQVRDFLDEMFEAPIEGVDWIITNPPFEKAEEFVQLALERALIGVAMLVRSTFLETQGRYRRLFAQHAPAIVAQFAERVPMHKGRWEPDGDTATAYCWIVWRRRPVARSLFQWIPPVCRQTLTRSNDVARFGHKPSPVPAPLLELVR